MLPLETFTAEAKDALNGKGRNKGEGWGMRGMRLAARVGGVRKLFILERKGGGVWFAFQYRYSVILSKEKK